MFFDADAAKKKVKKYEQKLEKLELKKILYEIKCRSAAGRNTLLYDHFNISDNNIQILEDYGYTIEEIKTAYRISW